MGKNLKECTFQQTIKSSKWNGKRRWVTRELMFSDAKLEKFDGDKFLDLLVKFAPVIIER